jgi:hypothetical protein
MTFTRREMLAIAGAALAGGPPGVRAFAQGRMVRNGRLKQSVSRWPYQKIPFPDFCRACADMGLTAIDLLEEPDWAVAGQHGLICSMGYAGGGSIPGRPEREGEPRRHRTELRAADSASGGGARAERHHLLRQQARHGRQRGDRQLRRRAQPGQENR